MHSLGFGFLLFALASVANGQEKGWSYLDNGQVRLGVNLDAGACIGWFSESGSKENLLNAYDVGRYVQQSYYGDEDGSDWNGKPWRYNPVQGGSWRNEAAKVVESKVDENSLYAKIHPRHWGTGKLLDEVTFEQWLRLEGGLARLKFRMTYTGTKEHRPQHQELPAVFVGPDLNSLLFMAEGGTLDRKQPGFPNQYFKITEPWAAWVNAEDRGVGIWCPHAKELTAYRVLNGNEGDCCYLAPLQTFALRPGLVFEYETALMIGSAEEIRKTFTTLKPHP